MTSLTRLFLDRSGSKPLDISVRTPASEYELQSQYIHHRYVLDALVRRAHRWRSVKLRIPYSEHHRLPASLPLLESLSIERIHDLFGDEREPWIYTYNLNAPRLRELKLSDDTALSRDLNCNSLTTLEMTCRAVHRSWDDPDDPDAIVTSQLVSLHLQGPWILERIELPRVSYLRIEDFAHDRMWLFDDIFYEFVLRSSPPAVTTLCLINCSNNQRILGDCLFHLPTITDLTIMDARYGKPVLDDEFLEDLMPLASNISDDGHDMLPNLVSLALRFPDDPWCGDPGQLMALLRSRRVRCRDTVKKLESLTVIINPKSTVMVDMSVVGEELDGLRVYTRALDESLS
ncbi:hypothetical protein Moror_8012 [Moniliophthora roreri MCA 2997]|uniref:F-box domain-containing protein n=2 Tax=Moniliophthora roreri TaxID=221103 RepID=V2XPS3_MONRO|nr:hypothetical protein Moror_8012 [Moniliophthora roreri MCA 2997]